MHEKLMLAMDDSSYSEAALKEAIDVAHIFGTKVIVVSVVDVNDEIFKVSPNLVDKLALQARQIVDKAEEKLKVAQIEVRTLIKEGNPHELVPELADQEGVDLIVLGTYGRKGLRLLLMGSVIAETIRQGKCDVLVVKEYQKKSQRGKYQSILVPYDGSVFSENALRRACQITNINQGDITVFYAIPQYQEVVLEFFKTSWMQEILMCEAKAIINRAKEHALKEGVTIKTVIENGNHIDVKIIETAKRLKIDLIVMGARGLGNIDRIIIGSVVRGVIVNAPCPVLIAKEG